MKMKGKEKEIKPSSSAGPAVESEQDFPRFRIDVVTKSDKSLPAELRRLGNIGVRRKIRKEKD